MASTKAEIRDIAASELGILRVGQALQHQDKVEIERRYDEVYADLKNEGLATWAASGSVPTEVAPHVAVLVAFSAADVYGISDSRYARLTAKRGLAERRIRALTQPHYESLDEPVDF